MLGMMKIFQVSSELTQFKENEAKETSDVSTVYVPLNLHGSGLSTQQKLYL